MPAQRWPVLQAKGHGIRYFTQWLAKDWRGADGEPHIPIVSFKWPEDWTVKTVLAVRTLRTTVDSAHGHMVGAL